MRFSQPLQGLSEGRHLLRRDALGQITRKQSQREDLGLSSQTSVPNHQEYGAPDGEIADHIRDPAPIAEKLSEIGLPQRPDHKEVEKKG